MDEEFLLASLEVTLKFWEEARQRRDHSHVMITLKGSFKGETGGRCHMLPLVDVTDSGIEIIKWVGRWLDIMVEDGGITERWVFHHGDGEQKKIRNIEKGF